MKFVEYIQRRDEYVGGLIGRAAGGALGGMLGVPGAIAGGMAGNWLGNKFDKWYLNRPRSKSTGMLGRFGNWLKNKYQGADTWAQKHPWISNAASIGAGALGAYGLHNWAAGDIPVGTSKLLDSEQGRNLLDQITQAQKNGATFDTNSWMIKGTDGSITDLSGMLGPSGSKSVGGPLNAASRHFLKKAFIAAAGK